MNLFMKVLTLGLFLMGAVNASEPVSLTNREGRTLDARIIRAFDGNVKIQLMDGRLFTLNVNTLDEESQKTVQAWQANQLLAEDIFQVSFTRRNLDRNVNNTRFGRVEDYRLQHVVSVRNTRAQEFPALEARYILFQLPSGYVGGTSSHKTFSGTAKLENIGQFGTVDFEMQPVLMRSRQSRAVRTCGGRIPSHSSRCTIDGIWIRFYEDGRLIGEFQQPTAFFRNREWDQEYTPTSAAGR